MDPTLKYTADQ